jgi:hypothetical protein
LKGFQSLSKKRSSFQDLLKIVVRSKTGHFYHLDASTMFRTLAKQLGFAALILCIGQIPVYKGTIGSAFVASLHSGFAWVQEQVGRRRPLDPVRRLFTREVKETKVATNQYLQTVAPRPSDSDSDEVTASDQDALLRVLP